GFDVVRRAPQVGRPIMVMAIFALCCLPFIGQLPAIAEVNLGVDGRSTTYGWFYATFGLGALVGAALVGTVLLRVDKPRLVRICLLGFAAALAALATAHTLGVAFPAVFAVAVFYLVMPTSLATLWQQHVDSSIRGRVAAIWVLSFGGMIPIANLVAGRVVEATSLDAVLLAGAVAAVVLAVVVRLPEGPVVTERILIDPGAEV
ncbi:MAG: MFS transporter, partial [Acidimicrobiia bacterium]|nr:MFS transporter [Acidimicrobiia bacterium]